MRPDVSRFTEELYEGLLPLAAQDEELGWPLLTYLHASGLLYTEIEDLVRDSDAGPGWSVAVDVDRAPVKFLPWLAQFVGVRLTDGADDGRQRQEIRDAEGFRRGTVLSMVNAARKTLSGTKKVSVIERPTSAYTGTIITYQSETPESDWRQLFNLVTNPSAETGVAGWTAGGTSGPVTPVITQDGSWSRSGTEAFKLDVTPGMADGAVAWMRADFPVTAGRYYALRHVLKQIDYYGGFGRVGVYIEWLNGAAAVVGSSDGPNLTPGTNDPFDVVLNGSLAPAGAVTARVYLRWEAMTGSPQPTYLIDAIGFGEVSGSGVAATDYFDGDTPGHSWSGTPHASISERDLTTITRDAIFAQKPAGIVLTHLIQTGQNWQELRDGDGGRTWQEVKDGFDTWDDVRANVPA